MFAWRSLQPAGMEGLAKARAEVAAAAIEQEDSEDMHVELADESPVKPIQPTTAVSAAPGAAAAACQHHRKQFQGSTQKQDARCT